MQLRSRLSVTNFWKSLPTIAKRISFLSFMGLCKKWPIKFVDVLRHNIHLDVYLVTDRYICERRSILRMRNNSDTESAVTNLDDRERYAINRHGTLFTHILPEFFWSRKGNHAAVAAAPYAFDYRRSVHMPLHEMTAKTAANLQRQFEVNRTLRPQTPERRSALSLRPPVGP